MTVDGLSRELTLKNLHGLHVRPSGKFVSIAMKYRSDVFVSVDGGEEGNGKSMLDLTTRAADRGAKMRIRVVGPDATEALEELCALVESGFGED